MRAYRTTGRAPDDRIDAARRRAASLGIRVDDDDDDDARVGACDGPTRPSLTRDVDARCDDARDGDDDARADERDGDDDDEYEYEYDDDESSRARASIGADARVGERDDDEDLSLIHI